MLTVKLSKNEKTGSAFIKIYEGDLMVLGLDVNKNESFEVHDWNGYAGDKISAIHAVIVDIINGVSNA